jgi:hypothetical protein
MNDMVSIRKMRASAAGDWEGAVVDFGGRDFVGGGKGVV